MKKYLSLFLKFISLSWMRSMEYRSDFITWVVVDIGWSCMDFLFTLVLIDFTQVLGHWTKGDVFIVLGFFRLLVVPIWGWMYQSFSLIPRQISEGKLDLLLTKPIDNQFMVSTQSFSFSIAPSLFAGIGFIIYGFKILGSAPTVISLSLSLWLTAISVLMSYGVYFSIIALSLYVERLNNIQDIFTSLYEVSHYPVEIFSPIFRLLFTTLIPISLIIVVPAQALFSPLNWLEIIYFHLLAIGFFMIGRKIWTHGLRRYSSGS